MIRQMPQSYLFPYTTLFRSVSEGRSQFTEPRHGNSRTAWRLPGWRTSPAQCAGALGVGRRCAGETVRARRPAHRAQTASVDRNSAPWVGGRVASATQNSCRSEEHTSELQSRGHLVCRLLLEKKNTE